MNITTGEIIETHDSRSLPGDPLQWVRVEGTPEQVRALSRNVQLGAREMQRRKARRQQQKQSRRKNRG